MGNLSLGEIVILAVIALIVFGGKGLPEAGKTIGRGLREFKRSLNEARDAVAAPDEPARPAATPPARPPSRLLE